MGKHKQILQNIFIYENIPSTYTPQTEDQMQAPFIAMAFC